MSRLECKIASRSISSLLRKALSDETTLQGRSMFQFHKKRLGPVERAPVDPAKVFIFNANGSSYRSVQCNRALALYSAQHDMSRQEYFSSTGVTQKLIRVTLVHGRSSAIMRMARQLTRSLHAVDGNGGCVLTCLVKIFFILLFLHETWIYFE